MAAGLAFEATGPSAFDWGPDDYAIIYCRVSDEIQTSIPEQITMGTAAADRLGLPVPDDGVYQDKGKSRDLFERRDGIQAALKRATDPHCRVLIAWVPSRLFADPEHSIKGFRHLARHHVRLFDTDLKEVDVSTPVGQLMGMIQGWQDKSEVEGLRKKVADTHRVKAALGRMISRPPYGVKVVPVGKLPCTGTDCRDGGKGCEIPHGEISKKGTVWVVDEEQRRVLLMMYGWAAEGVTLYEVMNKLAEKGILSPVREVKRGKNAGRVAGGVPWSQSNIRKMLLNRFYRGEFTWNKRRVVRDMEHEQMKMEAQPEEEWIVKPHSLGPLVDPKLWDDAAAQIARRYKAKDQARKYGVRLFDGFVYCGRCGWKFYPRKRANKLANGERSNLFDYTCCGVYSPYSSCTRNNVISESRLYKELEGRTLLIPGRDGEKVTFEASNKRAAKTSELKAIRAQLRDLEKRLEKVDEAYETGLWTREKVEKRTAELLTDQAAVLGRQDELLSTPSGPSKTGIVPTELVELVGVLRDETIPIHERRTSLGNVLDRIVVDRGNSIRIIWRAEGLQA